MTRHIKDTNFVLRLQNENRGQHDLQNTLKHWDTSRMFDDKQIGRASCWVRV